MSTKSQNKPARINIRVSEQEKDVISRAAEKMNTTVSEFVLTKAYAEAQAVLSVQSQFRLNNNKWNEFCKSLDSPPMDIPALRRLLSKRGVFDE